MRRLVLIPLLLLALFLAACGGSSGGDESAWQDEVEGVMSNFAEEVVDPLGEEVSAASDQASFEAIYGKFAGKAKKFGEEMKATDAPDQCVETREAAVKMADETATFGERMGDQKNLEFVEYAELMEKEGVTLGEDLTKVEELTEEC